MTGRFVGRRGELAETRDLITAVRDGTVLDVVGISGIGKSTFLEQVVRTADAAGALVFLRDLADDDTGVGFDEAAGLDAEAGYDVLLHTLLFTGQFLGEVQRALGRPARRLRDVARLHAARMGAIRASERTAGNSLTLQVRSRVENVRMAAYPGTAAVREAQAAVDEALVEAWAQVTARQPVVLALDNFDVVGDDETGRWLIRTALRLPRTVTVVARSPSGHQVGAGRRRVHRQPLAAFGRDEVREYLTDRIGAARVEEDLVELIYSFTDGHPGGVELATRYLVERLGADDRHRALDLPALRRDLSRLPDTSSEMWAELVGLIIDVVHDPRLRAAVDAAAVLGRFDVPALAALIEAPDDGDEVAEAIDALRGLGLIRGVSDAAGTATGSYRLHEFVGLALADKLRTTNPARWRRLHESAARYSYTALTEWVADGGDYSAWYSFENRDFQELKRDWLHHSGQITADPQLTLLRFLTVFLEAFWWWGCYHPFPLNRRLIEDWDGFVARWTVRPAQRTVGPAPRVAGQRLSDALRFLLDHYPPGFDKSPTAPWDEIQGRLLLAADVCGIGTGHQIRVGAADEPAVARARGLLAVFLAHTRFYADPADAETDGWYDRALATFTTLGEDWIVAYVLQEMADVAAVRGDGAAATGLAARSAATTVRLAATHGEWDHELLALLHRVRGDACWRSGDEAGAADRYRQAVLDAYWYQGLPNPPDGYTVRFYAEMAQRAMGLLVELAGRDPEAALRWAGTARIVAPAADEDLPALLRSGDPVALAAALLPRGPHEHELGDPDSDFMDDWRIRRQRAAPAGETVAALLAPSAAH